jgi:hypothetical protein
VVFDRLFFSYKWCAYWIYGRQGCIRWDITFIIFSLIAVNNCRECFTVSKYSCFISAPVCRTVLSDFFHNWVEHKDRMLGAPVLIIIIRTSPGSLAALTYDIQITRFHTV